MFKTIQNEFKVIDVSPTVGDSCCDRCDLIAVKEGALLAVSWLWGSQSLAVIASAFAPSTEAICHASRDTVKARVFVNMGVGFRLLSRTLM